MKTNLTLLLPITVMVSCQFKKSDSTETVVAEATEIDNTEGCTADTVKATAIFWIDKAETEHYKEYGLHIIKVKVLVREDGEVNLLPLVRRQSPAVETYIRHHLFKSQASEKISEGGYVQPGEQFVQPRRLQGMLKGK